MQIANDKAVSVHYTLTNAAGEVLDSSAEGDALVYLHGQGSIIAGLEQALTGKVTGDKFKVTIAPKDGYGELMEDMIQVVDKSMFEGIDDLELGMQFHADVSQGPGIVTIVAINGDEITLDGNHPLAGETLNFDVEVVDVREASAEELAHGHVHGAGGHHH
ncbi:MAG: peptidylprolyl isomerase [Methylococcaceae bacterium]|nr:peptidylprolyl isomerase [Methylococcaceae bacterium]